MNTFAFFTAIHYFVVVCHIKPRENTLRFVVKTQQNWNKCIYKVLYVTVNIAVFLLRRQLGLQPLLVSMVHSCSSSHCPPPQTVTLHIMRALQAMTNKKCDQH